MFPRERILAWNTLKGIREEQWHSTVKSFDGECISFIDEQNGGGVRWHGACAPGRRCNWRVSVCSVIPAKPVKRDPWARFLREDIHRRSGTVRRPLRKGNSKCAASPAPFAETESGLTGLRLFPSRVGKLKCCQRVFHPQLRFAGERGL